MEDMLDLIINQLQRQISNKREERLLAKLKEHGHEFETREELEEFAKERCSMEIHPGNIHKFFVDGELIVMWDSTFKIEMGMDGVVRGISG